MDQAVEISKPRSEAVDCVPEQIIQQSRCYLF
eukprot:SAG11_NODE_31509_length_291_cov_0.812500_1_plen_31_part_01